MADGWLLRLEWVTQAASKVILAMCEAKGYQINV
jgi:hypothetical protein